MQWLFPLPKDGYMHDESSRGQPLAFMSENGSDHLNPNSSKMQWFSILLLFCLFFLMYLLSAKQVVDENLPPHLHGLIFRPEPPAQLDQREGLPHQLLLDLAPSLS